MGDRSFALEPNSGHRFGARSEGSENLESEKADFVYSQLVKPIVPHQRFERVALVMKS